MNIFEALVENSSFKKGFDPGLKGQLAPCPLEVAVELQPNTLEQTQIAAPVIETDREPDPLSKEEFQELETKWQNLELLEPVPPSGRIEALQVLDQDPNMPLESESCKISAYSALEAMNETGLPPLVSQELLLMRLDEFQCGSCIQLTIQTNRNYCKELMGFIDAVDFFCPGYLITSDGRANPKTGNGMGIFL